MTTKLKNDRDILQALLNGDTIEHLSPGQHVCFTWQLDQDGNMQSTFTELGHVEIFYPIPKYIPNRTRIKPRFKIYESKEQAYNLLREKLTTGIRFPRGDIQDSWSKNPF